MKSEIGIVNNNTSSNKHYRKAFDTALRLLTRREHSKYEITQKLKQRGFSPEVIEKTISECERFDYISDERTARVLIRQMIRKGYGAKRIRLEMGMKRLRSNSIQRILSESVSEADEREGAEHILKKHIKKFERENDLKKKKEKIYRFLYSRGFSQEIISQLMKKY